MVRKLEAAPVTLTGGKPAAYRAGRDQALHSLAKDYSYKNKAAGKGFTTINRSATQPRVRRTEKCATNFSGRRIKGKKSSVGWKL